MSGRALTPEQKRAVVERIFRAWLAAPSLRLGQLLANAWAPSLSGDLFYAEDGPLADAAEALVGGPPTHDLTPAEVGRARVLAAHQAWTSSSEPGDGLMRDAGAALWRALLVTNAGALTDDGRALLDRARKAGVL